MDSKDLVIEMLADDVTDLGWALAYEKAQHRVTKEMLQEALQLLNQRYQEAEKRWSYQRYAS